MAYMIGGLLVVWALYAFFAAIFKHKVGLIILIIIGLIIGIMNIITEGSPVSLFVYILGFVLISLITPIQVNSSAKNELKAIREGEKTNILQSTKNVYNENEGENEMNIYSKNEGDNEMEENTKVKGDKQVGYYPSPKLGNSIREIDDYDVGLDKIMSIDEKAVAVNISATYRKWMNDDEILDCSRGIWRASKTNLEKQDYVFGVDKTKVVVVYRVFEWEKAGAYCQRIREELEEFSKENIFKGRYQFARWEKDEKMCEKYVGKEMPKEYKFVQNPVRYINL